MLAAAAAGYRAIAPDCRGYGLSSQPPEHEGVSWFDHVADVLTVLDALSVPMAFVVAKDFGVIPAYHFALRHPERTRGVASWASPLAPALGPSTPCLKASTSCDGRYVRALHTQLLVC
ncbi:hypothetical protein HU200_012520 [Digitaria exilis]|uniref:AB hydrolase-1 domain-containing protein n=1 Tax=Digitaria exilis TaxID=1010633 RepID=A0A835KN57_9POAL|nr:hypothetical protein HU200_058305 [Digitaria exilis]KAF8749907.1 hypothetical protein HU200_012520 [Digitaria exilis]